MRALISIEGTGRAADGRRLAMRAVLIQLGLFWLLFALIGVLQVLSGEDISDQTVSAVSRSALLLFVVWGISRDNLWIGIPYGCFFVFVIFSAMDLSLVNVASAIGTVVNAVLSFVALAGTLIWARNRDGGRT
jgi:uncharacterized membrane protein